MTPYQAAKLSFTITITILLVISQADQSFNAENQCHSSCSNGRFSRPLPFPFGFSSGCPIKLNCTSTGVTVGNFPVLNITSTDIIIDLPAYCSRKLASLSVLFGKNYALSSANSLLLHNCSKPSPGPCEMRPMFLGRSSTLKSCYAKSDNVSCFAATDGGQLLSFEEINNTQCRFLFTSTSIVTKNSAVSLEMERVRLEWWLDGDCNCDTNAKCTNVTKGKEGNNTLVGYRCHCNEGFEGDGFKAGLGCRKASRHGSSARIVILVGGAGLGFGILLVVICRAYRYYENRRRKMKLFESNGGLLLRQQLSSCEGNIGKTRIFTLKDMETATDNFSGSRILGKGGQGTVFQGKFADGRIVAVKRSKLVDRENIKEFINEIVILSQINHRHVVKLLGCCLETEVPLLVYEFVSNGALFQYLHGPHSKLSLTWGMRVRIASEAAGAISYLHSVASFPIYHRDIKSTNILLDEKFRAKVSDFGTSRSISIDQTHVTTLVHGTFGYLDPEYFETSQFTDKSDVYSFGVVLVELLTGKSPGSLARTGEDRSLATYFVASMEEDQLFEILDARILDECCTSEIIVVAGLAKKCLRLNGKDRPTMKEVAMELERVQQMQKKMNAKPNSEEPEPELKYVEEPDLLDIFEYVEEPELALPR